ncbi:MAG: PP0621 family protein [Campylobacterales bacterium]
MSLTKILVLALILGAIYFLLFKKKKPKTPKDEGEELIPCEACGTYISPKEAILKDGRFFCSKSCAKLPQ